MTGNPDGGEVPATNPDLPLAQLVGVSKVFGGTRALTDVTLTVRQGRTHGLVGRNGAGKSTLVGVFTGLVAPDTGEVRFGGAAAPPRSSPAQWQQKVSCVYQHRRLVPSLTVAENLVLDRIAGGRDLVSWKWVAAEARRRLNAWEIDINPRSLAADLSVENAQLVEIVRALSAGARFVILDEPTAQLVAAGIDRLFREVDRLKNAGVTFLFISHHLEEVHSICDEVTVLRNGRLVASSALRDMPAERMVAAMVGHDAGDRATAPRTATVAVPEREAKPLVANATVLNATVPVLAVDCLLMPELAEPISLQVGAGEIVGLAGQVGSGNRGIASCLVGFVEPISGRILRDGVPTRVRNPAAAIRAGIGYVPEDRHAHGYAAALSTADNIAAAVLRKLGRWGFVSPRRRAELARAFVSELDVACDSIAQPVGSLSGGNQQKVVMARALAIDPDVLVLVHPTAGVDVASKDTLFDAVDRKRRHGCAIVLVTDEVDELRHCDRVLVLFRGRLVRTFDGEWTEHAMVTTMEGVGQHV
jgi:simple sugar transport system ATP-binding protein